MPVPAKTAGQFHTIQAGHVEVGDHNVTVLPEFADHLQRKLLIGGFRDAACAKPGQQHLNERPWDAWSSTIRKDRVARWERAGPASC